MRAPLLLTYVPVGSMARRGACHRLWRRDQAAWGVARSPAIAGRQTVAPVVCPSRTWAA